MRPFPITRDGELDFAPSPSPLAHALCEPLPSKCRPIASAAFPSSPGSVACCPTASPSRWERAGFDLLVALVARAGRLVTKNELLDLVWPGLVVEENNLQVQISALRKLLGPSALATIPGTGLSLRAARGVASQARSGRTAKPSDDASPAIVAGRCGESGARDESPTNVPARLPVLFGRDGDVEAIKGAPRAHVVVTVVGAGGIGKTRVAQAVAGQLAVERAAEFPDGVWWVDLAPRFRRTSGAQRGGAGAGHAP